MKRLPNLADARRRDAQGVALSRPARATFTDIERLQRRRSYSLWDFMSEINAVVLYVTDGDDASFTLLQRATGRRSELPADPKLSPDRPRLVTADFCAQRCANELAVWRVTRDGVRKELDVDGRASAGPTRCATWKDAERSSIEYTRPAARRDDARDAASRRLADAGLGAAPSRRATWPASAARPCAGDRVPRDARRRRCAADAGPHRPIRSFVLRQGRMSPAQQRALESLLPRFGIPFAPAPLDFDRVFGRRAPRVLEIGFGMGETTAAIAQPRTRRSISSASRCTRRAWAAC